MKNNRRNRKLNFIRTKNAIRKGMSLHAFIKVSAELKESGDYTEVIEAEIKETVEKFSKKYKTALTLVHQAFGSNQDDFYHNVVTLRLSYKSTSHMEWRKQQSILTINK